MDEESCSFFIYQLTFNYDLMFLSILRRDYPSLRLSKMLKFYLLSSHFDESQIPRNFWFIILFLFHIKTETNNDMHSETVYLFCFQFIFHSI